MTRNSSLVITLLTQKNPQNCYAWQTVLSLAKEKGTNDVLLWQAAGNKVPKHIITVGSLLNFLLCVNT